MCGNVQLIFYRKTENKDILVLPLLNERPATLPVKTNVAPFYHWTDMRQYWMDTVKRITLPEKVEP